MKSLLVFIILFLTIAINLPHGMITRMGFDADILIAVLIAVVLTGLLRHKRLFLIVLVVFCALAANVPEEMIAGWGIDPDYFLGVLVALVLLPIGAKVSGKY
ncbi:MAG: hypothetical protein OQK32_03335 [Gammaproteobacteria bacterium]|nr:hypothetical protein [Gammaproteobacteria bacterium]MCW8922884.1 hypothetical protein [Gammaproteobacteria bacterium]